MTYTFFVKDNILFSGYTVYSDYAPHTAMIRSFSKGTNYPTQYPHFGGQDVKYHFMFQFLVGNMEYLGLRIDVAYNLLSTFSLVAMLMVLYQITLHISRKFSAGLLTITFFFFRSGTSIFRFIHEHVKMHDLLETIKNNEVFIGYTPNENWGLWCYNVYLNQRHLGFGLAVVACVIWFYLDYLDEGCNRPEAGIDYFAERFTLEMPWKPVNPWKAAFLGLMLGMTSFFNGASVIGGLLILLGFAIFSNGKFDYAITAIITISLTLVQTKTFIHGEGIKASFYWGFISEDKSLAGVLLYIFNVTFICIIGLLIYIFYVKRRDRAMIASFLLPFIFAFTGSLTPDVTVNHKYIMLTMAFGAILWGKLVSDLFYNRKAYVKTAAVILCICLTLQGLYDFVIVIKDNGPNRSMQVKLDSELTDWLTENVTTDDLLATPFYAMNEVTLSGCMLYLGWPYYPWSAGYDTFDRGDKLTQIYTTDDQNILKAIVSEEGIDYIIYDEAETLDGVSIKEDLIKETYPLVFKYGERIRIYETE